MLETKVESQADANPQETGEWMESLDSVMEEGGSERASFLLARLIDHAALYGIQTPHKLTTPYINTIPVEEEVPYPGDRAIERRIKSLNRWNAMAMVVRANKHDPGIGGRDRGRSRRGRGSGAGGRFRAARQGPGERLMKPSPKKILRCAIYTRKSSEEGLEQDFNSLHAQREACEAFIKSQTSEGWKLIKTAYDDGGISGGTMERPALQRLLADIGDGLIDVVVVYKSRPPDQVARRLRQDGRSVRCARNLVCRSHPAI